MGDFETEEEAYVHAEKWFRAKQAEHCNIREQLNHIVAALDLDETMSISELMTRIENIDGEDLNLIENYLYYASGRRDYLELTGPNGYICNYGIDLAYDNDRGFYYSFFDFIMEY